MDPRAQLNKFCFVHDVTLDINDDDTVVLIKGDYASIFLLENDLTTSDLQAHLYQAYKVLILHEV